ncbi:hypothetical protein CBR_g56093 [Chara braunii]|uniref:Uncharacterized protein n=1 Tax=Chara braunii TaxID=69332 RepID=A0A388MDE3_CHABU|nr:hypothetical protein CBR_g56093 [Chara braunii]|eukprot:GBG92580.1 hypothetical protein CBR_g56093 [Chara braunii]
MNGPNQPPTGGAQQVSIGPSHGSNLPVDQQGDLHRIRTLLDTCYDDGLFPETSFSHGEIEVVDGIGYLNLSDEVDAATVAWLKDRTVIVMFDCRASTFSVAQREQFIRIYEDAWFQDINFNPSHKRGRTHGEAPNVMSYVARTSRIAQWTIAKGQDFIPSRQGPVRVTFRPWMTQQELDQLRDAESAARYRIIALRIPLGAMFSLRNAVERLMGPIIHMHPPDRREDEPRLGNVKIDCDPVVERNFKEWIVLRRPTGQAMQVQFANQDTAFCQKCLWWFHDEFDPECPRFHELMPLGRRSRTRGGRRGQNPTSHHPDQHLALQPFTIYNNPEFVPLPFPSQGVGASSSGGQTHGQLTSLRNVEGHSHGAGSYTVQPTATDATMRDPRLFLRTPVKQRRINGDGEGVITQEEEEGELDFFAVSAAGASTHQASSQGPPQQPPFNLALLPTPVLQASSSRNAVGSIRHQLVPLCFMLSQQGTKFMARRTDKGFLAIPTVAVSSSPTMKEAVKYVAATFIVECFAFRLVPGVRIGRKTVTASNGGSWHFSIGVLDVKIALDTAALLATQDVVWLPSSWLASTATEELQETFLTDDVNAKIVAEFCTTLATDKQPHSAGFRNLLLAPWGNSGEGETARKPRPKQPADDSQRIQHETAPTSTDVQP